MKNWRTRKPVGLDGAHADEEGVGADAARQAGGFGIEKGPAGRATAAMAPAESCVQQIFGQARQVGDFHAAVAAVALLEALGFEVLAERRVDHLAAHPVLDEVAGRRGRPCGGAAAGGPSAYFRSMRAISRRKRGELFLEIAQFAFSLPTIPRGRKFGKRAGELSAASRSGVVRPRGEETPGPVVHCTGGRVPTHPDW